MVQAFGVLSGSALDPQEEGYLFILFRPDLLQPLDQAKRELTALIERIKATPLAPGAEPIRIPSERAFETRARLLREGLTVDRQVWDALAALRA